MTTSRRAFSGLGSPRVLQSAELSTRRAPGDSTYMSRSAATPGVAGLSSSNRRRSPCGHCQRTSKSSAPSSAQTIELRGRAAYCRHSHLPHRRRAILLRQARVQIAKCRRPGGLRNVLDRDRAQSLAAEGEPSGRREAERRRCTRAEGLPPLVAKGVPARLAALPHLRPRAAELEPGAAARRIRARRERHLTRRGLRGLCAQLFVTRYIAISRIDTVGEQPAVIEARGHHLRADETTPPALGDPRVGALAPAVARLFVVNAELAGWTPHLAGRQRLTRRCAAEEQRSQRPGRQQVFTL